MRTYERHYSTKSVCMVKQKNVPILHFFLARETL